MPAELFANAASTTVAASKTAVSAGTSESWTVGSSTGFPAADDDVSPSGQFRVIDPAAPTEIMRVMDVAGTTWTVIRGVEGTTPVAHAAGFTVNAILTAGQAKSLNRDIFVPMRSMSAALADVNNNPVDILFIGDSGTEGWGATVIDNRWVDLARDQLRSLYPVQGAHGGLNYLPCFYASGTGLPAPMTLAGSPVQGNAAGLGWRMITLDTGAKTATFTFTGTSCKLWYITGPGLGVGYYQLDGGSNVTFNTTGGANASLGSTAVSFSRGSHTIKVGWSSGGAVYFEGAVLYDGDETKGLRVYEAGWSSKHTSDWVAQIGSGTFYTDRVTQIAPDALVMCLGLNDYGQGIASATFKSNTQSIITSTRSAAPTVSVLLVALYLGDIATFGGTPIEPWANYVQAMYEVVEADPTVKILDLTSRLPQAAGDTLGLYNADGGHLSTKGYRVVGESIASALVTGLRPGPGQYLKTDQISLTPGPNANAAAGDVWIEETSPDQIKFYNGTRATRLDGWEPLYHGSLAAAATTLASGTIPACDELQIIVRIVTTSSADVLALRFNGDTGNNYWSRYITSVSGASPPVLVNTQTASTNMARLTGISVATGRVFEAIINNRLASGKVGVVKGATASGAVATVPTADLSGQFEWVNTSAQITSVTLMTVGGSATMGIGSGMLILGRNL